MRAQAAGQLRNDFVPEDLVLLLIANAGVVRGTREATPGQMYRDAPARAHRLSQEILPLPLLARRANAMRGPRSVEPA
jgi:hypothetical protein